jgi:hypothetical protein
VRVSHGLRAHFDEPNLVSAAGLAPVVGLAERAGLHELTARHLSVPGSAGSNPGVKVAALVAGMVAGADSIDDMALLRHGAMGRLFAGLRAPSTLGTFLRAFTFGHVRQLDAIAARLLAALAGVAPGLVAGAEAVAYVDIDDTVRATYGSAKQGAGYRYSRVKGLNLLLATLCTPSAAPLILATRLRAGATNSARGAARLVTDALTTARRAGAGGLLTLRADSAYYSAAVVTAARRAGARFSITARMDPAIKRAIGSIGEDAWTPIKYPKAVWDADEGRWVSDAQVAEVPFTAFTSRRKSEHVTARLIVRRVKRLNPATVPPGQGELFAIWRHHAVFTDSPLAMLAAEASHRDHAVIEQVIADLKDGPLAHLPSGKFNANGAWAVLAAVAFNLTRAAGTLASRHHAKARTATIRTQLITVPARIATTARRLHVHLPERWPWQNAYTRLFEHTCGPPQTATT